MSDSPDRSGKKMSVKGKPQKVPNKTQAAKGGSNGSRKGVKNKPKK
jgi:hypothetical protein